jgi:GNAT superfamily N-acetyltransferase
MFQLTEANFPEEGALLRWRPGAFETVVDRVFRPDMRLLLWLMEKLRHPIVKAFALEVDQRLVGAALLSFTGPSGYISSVVVDAPYRGRGYATQIVRACESAAYRLGRRYAVLDVLRSNAPARSLYLKLGYRPIRGQSYHVRDYDGPAPPEAPLPEGLRPFVRADAKRLVAVATSLQPAEVTEVLPPHARQFSSIPIVATGLKSETEAWVVDRGNGPEGFVRATVSAATESGHLTAPLFAPGVTEDAAAAAVDVAVGWLRRRGVRRVVCEMPSYNTAGTAALARGGFHEALPLDTYYHPLPS